MKKMIKEVGIILLILFFTIFIIINSNLIINEIIKISVIWFKKVFPSLFIFIIIGDLLLNYNIIKFLNPIFNKLFNKLFKNNPNSSFVFFMSMLSGFPSSAKYVKDLNKRGYLSDSEASKTLTYTFFSNPIFIITMSNYIFNNTYYSIIIIISHYLGNILTGIFFRNEKTINNNIMYVPDFTKSFQQCLTISFKKVFDVLLMILGTIIFYYLIYIFIINILSLNSTYKTIISGILELTQGLNNLKTLDNDFIKLILFTSFLSFGGLSILSQIKSILSDTNISYKLFIKSRIIHFLLSILILLMIIILN